ncbi:NAD(P)-binding protein [Penicillium brevicompactum]|uniref:NAD(P)-binding protein n=1 Tax=Penicillium brevicompactum TaxID=5074 RepID=A0A9W9ULR6_PENBR|nr:NAD(P)-binding protein [Penicillium brevicompactum]
MASRFRTEHLLITGVTGYIGFQTLILALERGYFVRAVVRSESSIDELKRTPAVAESLDKAKLDIVVIPDFLEHGAFLRHLDGITAIIHLASPLSFSAEDLIEGIVKPAVSMVTTVLEAAARSPSIRRVVLTSSCVTLIPFEWNMSPDSERLYHVDDINESVGGPYETAMQAYWASKGLARIAAKDFVRDHQPHFDFVNLLPSVVIGPDTRLDVNPTATPDDLLQGARACVLAPALVPSLNSSFPFVGTPVHVADVAKAHVDAVDCNLVPGNSEFILSSDTPDGVVWDRDVQSICREFFPTEVSSKHLPMEGFLQAIKWRLDAEDTKKVFGWEFVPFSETMRELISQYLRLGGTER